MKAKLESLGSPLWGFVRYHLLFFLPIRLEEFMPGTPRAQRYDATLAEWDGSLATLADSDLEAAILIVKDELGVVRSSIAEMRSRAAQLLAVTGFVTVLATLGVALPTGAPSRLATLIVFVLAGYALLGTLWLTVQVIAVRRWPELKVRRIRSDSIRADREQYAKDLYRVYRELRVRRDAPMGYLRDGYWFFLITVVLIVVLVAIRLVSTASRLG